MKCYEKTNPESIQLLFGKIAKNYDRTNGILSFQLHRLWNALLIKESLKAAKVDTFLDLCSGTGEIAYGILAQSKEPKEAFLLDFCPEMLECAKLKKPKCNHTIRYIQGDAQKIPLPNTFLDLVTVAYGIRNVKDPLACIQESYRVLKNGGAFAILELTQPKNPILSWGHSLYLRFALPIIGKLMTQDKEAYSYLCKSIPRFIPPEELEKMMEQTGFKKVRSISLTGGIATIIIGVK